MSQNLSEENLIRNYLLDELTETEQDLVHERLLMDPEFFETSLIIEDELMDDYALGLLSPKDQVRVKEYLLKSPQQFKRVQFTRTLELYILNSKRLVTGYQDLTEAPLKPRNLRHLIEEEAVARKYVVSRYQMLIDRKYLAELTPSETEELAGLKAALDAMDKPYYEAIITRLHRLVERVGV